MPTSEADVRGAVAILRGLKTRIDRLEERSTPEGPVNQIRVVNESASGDDTASVRVTDATVTESASADDAVGFSTEDAGGMTWNTSKWDFTEWAESATGTTTTAGSTGEGRVGETRVGS